VRSSGVEGIVKIHPVRIAQRCDILAACPLTARLTARNAASPPRPRSAVSEHLGARVTRLVGAVRAADLLGVEQPATAIPTARRAAVDPRPETMSCTMSVSMAAGGLEVVESSQAATSPAHLQRAFSAGRSHWTLWPPEIIDETKSGAAAPRRRGTPGHPRNQVGGDGCARPRQPDQRGLIAGAARALGPDRDKSFLGNNPGSVHPFGRHKLGSHRDRPAGSGAASLSRNDSSAGTSGGLGRVMTVLHAAGMRL
jgi:hypothetical protein